MKYYHSILKKNVIQSNFLGDKSEFLVKNLRNLREM